MAHLLNRVHHADKLDAGTLARKAIMRGAVQNEKELTQLVAIMQKRPRPQAIVEIGVMNGGTIWLWRRLAAPDPNGTSIAIDKLPEPVCDDCQFGNAHNLCTKRQYIYNLNECPHYEPQTKLLVGDSRDPEIVKQVRETFPDGIDFLFIDGDHGPGCLRDFDLYAPLVRAEGLIAIHDVCLDLDNPGPLLTAGELVHSEMWGPRVLWERLQGAPGAATIFAEGGYGIGTLVGHEWKLWENEC